MPTVLIFYTFFINEETVQVQTQGKHWKEKPIEEKQ